MVAYARVDPGPVVRDRKAHDPVLGLDRHPHVRARRCVPHGVVEQGASDLLDALLVAYAPGRRRRRACEDDPAAVPRAEPAELPHERARGRGQVDGLADEADGAGVEPAQVEQVARELRQATHLLAGGLHELDPGLRVEVLLGQELEKPAEREERRAKLMRRVRDEVLPRAVDLREPGLHEVERPRDLADLVG